MRVKWILILLIFFIAGCDKTEKDDLYFTDGEYVRTCEMPKDYIRVFEAFEKKIDNLSEQNSKLLKYIKCPRHDFCFFERYRGGYVFRCKNCGLKRHFTKGELTDEYIEIAGKIISDLKEKEGEINE